MLLNQFGLVGDLCPAVDLYRLNKKKKDVIGNSNNFTNRTKNV